MRNENVKNHIMFLISKGLFHSGLIFERNKTPSYQKIQLKELDSTLNIGRIEGTLENQLQPVEVRFLPMLFGRSKCVPQDQICRERTPGLNEFKYSRERC